jgi:hypothetical protein
MLRRNAKDANGRARARRKEGKRSSGAKKSNMSAEIYLFNPGTHSGLASWKIKRERAATAKDKQRTMGFIFCCFRR